MGNMGDYASQELVGFPKARLGTFAAPGASRPAVRVKESTAMLGKLAGAWLGDKIAGPNQGAKGAILGYGAAAVARRSVPAIAALALGAWAFRKWRGRRRGSPAYPSEAAPSPSSSA
jgi:hypothetical protein